MADKLHVCVIYFKWSFVFTGTMCLISAYTTNYWQQNSHTRIGLWKICEGGINCSSIKFEENAGIFTYSFFLEILTILSAQFKYKYKLTSKVG